MTPQTSKGFEVIAFAKNVLNEPLLPYQQWLAIHALELLPNGKYRFNIVLSLIARQNGKTHFQKVLTLWKMYMGEVVDVLGVAQDLGLALESMQDCIRVIEDNEFLLAEFAGETKNNGRENFKLKNNTRYFIKAANEKAARGRHPDHIIFDEIRQQYDNKAWSAISKTIMARPNAQLWAISNAGDDKSVTLNNLRAAGMRGDDQHIGLFEWSAPDGCALDDRNAWAQANPGLGYIIEEHSIKTSMSMDEPAVFRTEVLCQHVSQLDAAVNLAAWNGCGDPKATMDNLRDRLYACVDVSLNGEHVTLAVAAERDDGTIQLEIAGSWRTTEDARKAIPALIQKVKPVAVGWFPSGPSNVLGPEMRKLEALDIKGGAVVEACQSFADIVQARKVLHNEDNLLGNDISGAQKLYTGDGWRFTRRGAGEVDAAYAAAGAVHILRTMPEEIPLPQPMVV